MAEVLYLGKGKRAARERDLQDPEDVGGPRTNELTTGKPPHRLDSPESRTILRQLLRWYYFERDRQATNRLEMAIDADFYDGLQWDPEDAAIVTDRGQMPLVFNEVSPMCDWMIGTERRNRVDWRVLPRTEDDVELADVKTKTLKYVADVNHSAFHRSRAFAEAIKAGLSFLDMGVRDDPTAEILYDRWESWRQVLRDSTVQEMDTSEGRYIFRWRWVDVDIAKMMFPDRADVIDAGIEQLSYRSDPMGDDDEFGPTRVMDNGRFAAGQIWSSSSMYNEDATRPRIKLIECQFKQPANVKMIADGPFRGAFFDPRDRRLAEMAGSQRCSIIDKVAMRVHVAVFTESDLLGLGPSIYRHNRFSLTPIWCYRRSSDGEPYGMIRRVRDVQQDLNKRASKAQWLVNTNQVFADEGAVDDIEETRDEAQRPDGVLIGKAGKRLEIRRDTDQATGQLQLMALDAQSIQKSGGVENENLGRQTNATSGEAIKARQLQGSVVTTEPFDNRRLAEQIHGEKALSLVEQFYTQEKVIRLTGARGQFEWVKINTPEVQPDGSVRYLNDITESAADFVVSEQDYAGTMRQTMLEYMTKLAERLPDPGLALRVFIRALEFSDWPNKDDLASELRRLIGDRDPNQRMTPEEQQAAEDQARQQQEAMEVQRQTAIAAMEEQQAKVREVNARATELEAKAEAARMGGDGAAGFEMQRQFDRELMKLREAFSSELERVGRELAKAQQQANEKITAVKADKDKAIEVARIQKASAEEVAKIQAASDDKLASLMDRFESLNDATLKKIEALDGKLKDGARDVDSRIKDVQREAKAAVAPAPAAAPAVAAAPVAAPAGAAPAAAPAPAAVAAQPPAAAAAAPVAAAAGAAATRGPRRVIASRNDQGLITGGTIVHADGTTESLKVERNGNQLEILVGGEDDDEDEKPATRRKAPRKKD